VELKTLLVHIDPEVPSPALIRCAIDMAQRHGAGLFGVAGVQPAAARVGFDGAALAAAWYAEEREQAEAALKRAEDQFYALVPKQTKHGFRSFLDSPNAAVAAMAHRADLILVGSHPAGHADHERHLDVGELVLAAGRPVLVVGSGVMQVWADKVVIAWKDTREARRAVADALPLLRTASEVLVAVVDEGDGHAARQSADELAGWLDSHGVNPRSALLALEEGGHAATIAEAAERMGADLVVAGGYGHSRMREWLLGGMTRGLLAETTLNRLFSN